MLNIVIFDMNWKTRIKYWLFRQLFTENEKCLLNQALNLQKLEIYEDAKKGVNSNYKEDLEEVSALITMCENSLWN